MERGETRVGEAPADHVLIDDGRMGLHCPDRRARGASRLRGVGSRGITARQPEGARRAQIAIRLEKVDATGDRARGFDDALRQGIERGVEGAVDGEAGRGLRQGNGLPPHAPVLRHILDDSDQQEFSAQCHGRMVQKDLTLPRLAQHRYAAAPRLGGCSGAQVRTDLFALAWHDGVDHLRPHQVFGGPAKECAGCRIDVDVMPRIIRDDDGSWHDLDEGSNDFIDRGSG